LPVIWRLAQMTFWRMSVQGWWQPRDANKCLFINIHHFKNQGQIPPFVVLGDMCI